MRFFVMSASWPRGDAAALGRCARNRGFAVSLSGAENNVQGVILCNQPRILDIAARCGRFREKVPEYIVDEVIAKLQTLLD